MGQRRFIFEGRLNWGQLIPVILIYWNLPFYVGEIRNSLIIWYLSLQVRLIDAHCVVEGEVRQLISLKTPNWDPRGNFLYLGEFGLVWFSPKMSNLDWSGTKFRLIYTPRRIRPWCHSKFRLFYFYTTRRVRIQIRTSGAIFLFDHRILTQESEIRPGTWNSVVSVGFGRIEFTSKRARNICIVIRCQVKSQCRYW